MIKNCWNHFQNLSWLFFAQLQNLFKMSNVIIYLKKVCLFVYLFLKLLSFLLVFFLLNFCYSLCALDVKGIFIEIHCKRSIIHLPPSWLSYIGLLFITEGDIIENLRRSCYFRVDWKFIWKLFGKSDIQRKVSTSFSREINHKNNSVDKLEHYTQSILPWKSSLDNSKILQNY